jgi:hypothetical protein
MTRPAAPALACLLAGCATAMPGPSSGTPAPVAATAVRFAVLRAGEAPAGTSVAASDAEPLHAGTVRWAVLPASGTGAATNADERTEPLPDGRFRRTTPDAIRTLSTAADGTVRLDEQVDAKDGASTLFEPPLPIAPPRLETGHDFASDAAVAVLRGAVREREGGRAQRTMRVAGTDRIATPLGEQDAVRIETTFTMKVPFASLRRDVATWVVRGTGPVAVRIDERILVMGVVPRDRHEVRVRLPAAGGDR